MKKEEKTNVMRVLSQHGIEYESYCYADTDAVSGADVARVLGQDPDHVFKTLVTTGASREHYVFMIPVLEELDLKKAAASVKEKSIVMLPQKELLPLTGYIHGGCSPIGMKKQFKTVIHETAILYDTILYSAGKIGYQVETTAEALNSIVALTYRDVCV